MDKSLSGNPGKSPVDPISVLMEEVHQASLKAEHSSKTELAYADWIYRFITFHGRRHPREMGRAEISAFLSYLATERQVAASSQHQARFALAFLYEKVLGIEGIEPRYKHLEAEERMPTVLTRKEVIMVLNQVGKESQLMAALIYGCGLRLKEVVGLRLRDLDFKHHFLRVHNANGTLDRAVMLPRPLKAMLQIQVQKATEKHAQNMAVQEFVGVVLPKKGSRAAPAYSKELREQFLFPSPKLHEETTGLLVQRSISESSLQKAVKTSFKKAGLGDQGSCATLRHSFAAHLLESGQKIQFVQKLLGQKEVRYTKLYMESVGKGKMD